MTELSEAEQSLIGNSEEDAYLLEAARIGIDVHVFRNTQGGRHLYDMAMKDLQDNLLVILDCSDLTDNIARQAHAEARKAVGILDYMQQAMTGGKLAEEELSKMDDLEEHHE